MLISGFPWPTDATVNCFEPQFLPETLLSDSANFFKNMIMNFHNHNVWHSYPHFFKKIGKLNWGKYIHCLECESLS